MMVAVVQEGTGTAAQIAGVTVAGKTGTAQTDGGAPHAWFIGVRAGRGPAVAVAVIIEHGGSLGQRGHRRARWRRRSRARCSRRRSLR